MALEPGVWTPVEQVDTSALDHELLLGVAFDGTRRLVYFAKALGLWVTDHDEVLTGGWLKCVMAIPDPEIEGLTS